jgi:hypothetical protein
MSIDLASKDKALTYSTKASSDNVTIASTVKPSSEEVYGESPTKDSMSAVAGTRINYVVQWVRSRFNVTPGLTTTSAVELEPAVELIEWLSGWLG